MILRGSNTILKSAINPHTGYGNDGISLARHLDRHGVDVHLEPSWVSPPLDLDTALLLTKPRAFGPINLVIDHMDPEQLGLSETMAAQAQCKVAWSMWEFIGFGPDNAANRRLKERLEPYNLVLAYDEVSRQTFSEYVDDDRLQILQGGYESADWMPEEHHVRDWDSTFIFGMAGALSRRKNPFATINAFNKLKNKHGDAFDAELHLKTNMPGLHPAMETAYPGVKIFLAIWDRHQMKDFYANLNCLVAPSWGEGKNLPALEAQTMGVPVIASKFGGHLQWADSNWAYLIDGALENHVDDMTSIRVNEDELAELMWHVYSNRYEAKLKGQRASEVIPKQCDWSTVVEKLDVKLRAIN